ncbi:MULTISPECIES: LysR family transcriptional regulator [unclassified Paracoccus (in: a-proteobacteria)]|uniref:LysR family transcriptional regulator n=2 Tax=Paracoccus TaxID=265 RepID=UPI0025E135EE|nr:LysR family transcriptional regulator [Paracoccus sp. UBA889]|tara:strand:- start:13124 stop:14287 length:1164 start_codon:yes stop_codon:yes gene_type:complete
MPVGNLRHLRVFLAVAEGGSVTRAAAAGLVSQPAVTQAIAKLESQAGTALFRRTRQGLFPTEAGRLFQHRAARALARLDMAMSDIAPRLRTTATRAQLTALIAAVETQNFTLAAYRLGIAQPTLHRAITAIEAAAGRALFQRSAVGVAPSRPASALALAARLAFAELDQAVAELAELEGREVGRIVIGALPLSRAHVLPRALARFRQDRPRQPIRIMDGIYGDLLAGLRRGEIDLIIGALRQPLPVGDVVQERLFDDVLAILAGPDDPLIHNPAPLSALRCRPWLVARRGTPTRDLFEALFRDSNLDPPASIIETGSVILMREMVGDGRHLACVSKAQAAREIERGIVAELPFPGLPVPRPIGLTLRSGWQPTRAQQALLDAIRAAI